MSNDPEQIRSEIAAIRSDLSSNVNALTESVKPGNVARRQADKVTDAVSGVKDRVMGASDEAASAVPAKTRSGTRGNPVAAGLIAFGAGWLLGSLLPASDAEQQAATALKDKAQPLTDHVTQAAKDVVSNLQEPAQQAVQEVRSTASDAAGTVKDEAQSSASDLKSSSPHAVGEVRQQTS